MSAITVKAAPGLRVPREDNGRKYITDDTQVPVEQTAYYLLRLADGDPIEVQATPTDAPAVPGNGAAARGPAKKGA